MPSQIYITGQVYDGQERVQGGGYVGIPSPKVFISDKDGKPYKEYRVIGGLDGRFQIMIPALIKRGKYLTTIVGTDKVITPLVTSNEYNIDMGFKKGVQDVTEATVVGKRPTPFVPTPKEDPKMSTLTKVLIGLGIALVVGTATYLIVKSKKPVNA